MPNNIENFAVWGLGISVPLVALGFLVYLSFANMIFENKKAAEEGLKELAEDSEEDVTDKKVRSWGREMYSAHLYISFHKKYLWLMIVGGVGWIISKSYLILPESYEELYKEVSLLGVENYVAIQYVCLLTWTMAWVIETPLIYEFRYEVFKSYKRKKEEVIERIREEPEEDEETQGEEMDIDSQDVVEEPGE